MRPAPALARSLAPLALAAALAAPALAAPGEYLPVGDPLEAELRVLELHAPPDGEARLSLPGLHSRPLRLFELVGPAPVARRPGARGIALARLARALHRDIPGAFEGPAPRGATPRLVQLAWPGEQRLEVSAGLEGEALWTDAASGDRSSLADGSGLHVRGTFQVDRWIGHAHLWAGQLRDVTAFSDALIADSDLAVSTGDSWLAYDGGRAWGLRLGRSRWHWGPGEEASLLLSKTSTPLSGLALHARIEALRADVTILNATVAPGRGEQLAAHRLEWRPADAVRLGIAEAARYRASGWLPLYASGLVPYSIAQRLLDQDEGGGTEANRNNVMIAADASVRIADGSRAYGEVLVDDLHARSGDFPNKLAWQAGWDGAGEIEGTRLTWNAEYTRLSRYVYTSYFGREHAAGGRPLGHPLGPDAARLRLRASWDPCVNWQWSVLAARTERGESGLGTPFEPGTPVPDVFDFAGTVETTRVIEVAARWWPASGADVALRAGREWVANAGHVPGEDRAAWRGALALRLAR